MTFEEFFIKKKIDLVQLRQAKPDLYAEFHEHYLKMGEKSFDHTKKYWFNRLRKDYLLLDTEEVPIRTKPVSQPPSGKVEKTVPKTGAAAAKPVGFKPRFKAGTTSLTKTDEPKQGPAVTPAKDTPETTGTPAKPLGFKPRFKAGVTPAPKTNEPKTEAASKTQEDHQEGKTNEKPASPDSGQPTKPIGFKPRFKPGITKPKKD